MRLVASADPRSGERPAYIKNDFKWDVQNPHSNKYP
jgi:hypothetical protein